MSSQKPVDEKPSSEVAPAEKHSGDKEPKGIFLVPYPKIVFFYPTFIVAIVCAIWMGVTGRVNVEATDTKAVAMTWVFLSLLALNMCIITFDFPRATSLTMLFFFAAAVLGGMLLFTFRPEALPEVVSKLVAIRPVANVAFFAVVSVVLALIYVAVFIKVRFDYWELRSNELLHHHGILSDLKRYSTKQLRIDKEINDVFEYLLLRSGRLILLPREEKRAIVLDNVLFISDKERHITRLLSTWDVEVRSSD